MDTLIIVYKGVKTAIKLHFITFPNREKSLMND